MIRTKTFKFDVKASGDAGMFTGRASVYGVEDFHGDVVMPGAFADTIRDHGGVIKVLNQHDPCDPIGTALLEDAELALMASGSLVLELQSAKDAYVRLQNKLVDGISIGYSVPDGGASFEGGVRKLNKIDLWEISLVTFPANDYARVTGVKSQDAALRTYEIAAGIARELKAGRALSQANAARIAQAHEHLKSISGSADDAMEVLQYLLGLVDDQDAKSKAKDDKSIDALSALLADMRNHFRPAAA
jgi:HK97 family phage prohead protease